MYRIYLATGSKYKDGEKVKREFEPFMDVKDLEAVGITLSSIMEFTDYRFTIKKIDKSEDLTDIESFEDAKRKVELKTIRLKPKKRKGWDYD